MDVTVCADGFNHSAAVRVFACVYVFFYWRLQLAPPCVYLRVCVFLYWRLQLAPTAFNIAPPCVYLRVCPSTGGYSWRRRACICVCVSLYWRLQLAPPCVYMRVCVPLLEATIGAAVRVYACVCVPLLEAIVGAAVRVYACVSLYWRLQLAPPCVYLRVCVPLLEATVGADSLDHSATVRGPVGGSGGGGQAALLHQPLARAGLGRDRGRRFRCVVHRFQDLSTDAPWEEVTPICNCD